MASKLYVGNLSYQTREEDLNQLFAKAGAVTSVKIVVDRSTGQSRGFGFVEMATAEEAKRAVSMLNGTSLHGREIVVDQARTQGAQARSQGPHPGGRR